MSTTNRNALLSSEGDELLSGSRLLEDAPPPTLPAVAPLAPRRLAEIEPVEDVEDEQEQDDEPVPETLRSSVFVRAHEPVSRPIVIEMDEDHRAA